MRNRYACDCSECRRRNAEAERALFESILTYEEVKGICDRIMADFPRQRVLEFASAGDDG